MNTLIYSFVLSAIQTARGFSSGLLSRWYRWRYSPCFVIYQSNEERANDSKMCNGNRKLAFMIRFQIDRQLSQTVRIFPPYDMQDMYELRSGQLGVGNAPGAVLNVWGIPYSAFLHDMLYRTWQVRVGVSRTLTTLFE